MRPIAIPLIAVMLLCIPLGRCSETRADYVTGTGFVVHPDGWIVTCNHVIECAAEPRDQSIVAGWPTLWVGFFFCRFFCHTSWPSNSSIAIGTSRLPSYQL